VETTASLVRALRLAVRKGDAPVAARGKTEG